MMDPKYIAKLLRQIASGATVGPLEQHYLGKYADEIDPSGDHIDKERPLSGPLDTPTGTARGQVAE